jgi:hypothetical protein
MHYPPYTTIVVPSNGVPHQERFPINNSILPEAETLVSEMQIFNGM